MSHLVTSQSSRTHQAHGGAGATENAGLENAGPSKMQGWITRDWKTPDRLKGGGKRGTKMQGWKTQDWKTRDHHSGGGKRDQ